MTEPVKGSPEWIKAEQSKKGWGTGKSCLGCLGIFILMSVGIGACTAITASNQEPYDPNNSSEAIIQCEDRVEALLKAPTTAEFDSNATGGGSDRVWTVTGTVDAENSFGAKVRSDYGCTVTMHEDSATTSVDYFND